MSEQDNRVREKLLTRYRADEQGTWQIFGEDPNCDFGGSHVEPLLGIVQGDYAAAVEHALGLPSFFTWGGGGRIEPIHVVKVDGNTLRQRGDQQRDRRRQRARGDEFRA